MAAPLSNFFSILTHQMAMLLFIRLFPLLVLLRGANFPGASAYTTSLVGFGHDLSIVRSPNGTALAAIFHINTFSSGGEAGKSDFRLGIDEDIATRASELVRKKFGKSSEEVRKKFDYSEQVAMISEIFEEYMSLLRPRSRESLGPPLLALTELSHPSTGLPLPPLVLHKFESPQEAAESYCLEQQLSPSNILFFQSQLRKAFTDHACADLRAPDGVDSLAAAATCFARQVSACKRHLGEAPFRGYELERAAGDSETWALLRHYASMVPSTNAHARGPTCVETGTYEAETTIEMAKFCSRVYTIELDNELARKAALRLEKLGIGDSIMIPGVYVDGEDIPIKVARSATMTSIEAESSRFCSSLQERNFDVRNEASCLSSLTEHLAHHLAKVEARGTPIASVLVGDSGKVLREKIFHTEEMPEPALFWLDGHWSVVFGARGDEDSPILQELDAIFSRGNDHDIILVDDVRTFRGRRVRQDKIMNGSYLPEFQQVEPCPELKNVLEFVCEKRPTWIVSVKDDLMRLHAPQLVGSGNFKESIQIL